MTALCKKLYLNFDCQEWNEHDLRTLPVKELVFLCHMMGVPHYGNKETIIVRLLSLRIVRFDLSKFADDPAAVVESFKRDRLRWMCVQANLWKSGSKIQLASVLLSWRNKCRHAGQEFLKECIAFGKSRGVQTELSL